jgi:PIN domain nuclease of toxin-antitoxin system
MKLLIDTHYFLWYISGDAKLPASIRETIRDPQHEVYLSVASIWEAIIKNQLGKLPLPQPASQYVPSQRDRHKIDSLPLDEDSVVLLGSLPPIHRGPFDRMLICQVLQHQLVLATGDPLIHSYPVPVLFLLVCFDFSRSPHRMEVSQRIGMTIQHSGFPQRVQLWRGALLTTIAHAMWVTQYPELAYEVSWDGLFYSRQNTQGTYGTIAFVKNGLVGVFRDDRSPRGC